MRSCSDPHVGGRHALECRPELARGCPLCRTSCSPGAAAPQCEARQLTYRISASFAQPIDRQRDALEGNAADVTETDSLNRALIEVPAAVVGVHVSLAAGARYKTERIGFAIGIGSAAKAAIGIGSNVARTDEEASSFSRARAVLRLDVVQRALSRPAAQSLGCEAGPVSLGVRDCSGQMTIAHAGPGVCHPLISVPSGDWEALRPALSQAGSRQVV